VAEINGSGDARDVTLSWTLEHVAGPSGDVLGTRHWPAGGRRKLVSLLLVHGLGEHSGRYDHVARRLASKGIDVHAFDLRGFGASAGRRAFVRSWSEFHDDVEARLSAVRATSRGRPVVLYGHSMGGLVALGYVLTDRPKPDMLVLTAPALDSTTPAWQRALARVLSPIAPRFAARNGFDGSVLSRDPTVGAKYLADPLNYHRSTVRLGAEALAEQDRVRAALERLAVPTLVLHGEDDRLVPPAASQPLVAAASVKRLTYPGLRHEIHNEPEWETVMTDVVTWIGEHVPPPAPRASRSPRSKIATQPNTPPGSAESAESVARPQTRGT
jgi:alpha-beta hydrolase superfamily lysophospholipase